MSTDYVCDVFVCDTSATVEQVIAAMADVVNTASLHAAGWTYESPRASVGAPPDGVGVLAKFAMGLASPYYHPPSTADQVARALRSAIRAVVGPKATIHVDVLNSDRADWRNGLPRR